MRLSWEVFDYEKENISEGRYLEAKNGVSMIILDNSPVRMSNRTNQDLFGKLETGNTILILHDGIAESYPGKTVVYAVFKPLEDLERFKLNFGEILNTDHGYDEVPSFNEAAAKYDEAFFEKNTLLLVYVATNSGSLRFDVSSMYCDDMSLCIHVKQTNNPEVVTEDMAGWFITVSVADDMIEKCDEFDTDFNNSFN